MSRRAAGAPSSTSTTASAARRIAGPRSTSSSPMCGAIGCKRSCAGVSIDSGGTLRHLVMLLDDWQSRGDRVRHAGRGDRHQHAGRQARRRRPRLDRRVRARAHSRARSSWPRACARPRPAPGPEALRRLGRTVRGGRESLDPAGGRAPRRLAYGGRPLARCKQDPSGSDPETSDFPASA